MLLSDTEIHAYAMSDELISPFNDFLLQPASYDMTLDHNIVKMVSGRIDPFNKDKNYAVNTIALELPYVLKPGEFVIGSTQQKLNVPATLGGRFEGKSSLGRIGLATHITAGFVDPGFKGTLTVEIANLSNAFEIVLSKGMKIGQICFYKMSKMPSKPYGNEKFDSHYQNQSIATISQYMTNKED